MKNIFESIAKPFKRPLTDEEKIDELDRKDLAAASRIYGNMVREAQSHGRFSNPDQSKKSA